MSLFSKKLFTSNELIFDIESDSVCTAIVAYSAGNVPHILYHRETEIAGREHGNSASLTESMLKALETSADSARSAMQNLLERKTIDTAHINRTHIVLSSPWIISKLSCITEKFGKTMPDVMLVDRQGRQGKIVRRSDVANLILKEKNAAATAFAVGDSVPIDTKLFEIKINGYPVADYEGKHATTLDGTMIISFASQKMLNDMKSRINRTFRTNEEIFHSALILRYAALRSVMPKTTDYSWFQIHGELTDVLIVRQGVCAISASLPFGSNTLTRKYALLAKESAATAVSALELASSGSHTNRATEKTKQILEKILSGWTQQVIDLVFGGNSSALPAIAYVSAGNYGFAFESALKKSLPAVSTMRMDSAIMAPFVKYAPSVSADLSASLYSAALPLLVNL